MTKKNILILQILLLNVCFAQQYFDTEKLNKYFDALEVNNKFMGSIAVSKNGEIVYTKTIGFADAENNIKASENSKYRIGSISKMFTSALVFLAIEMEKIVPNQTINKYFPAIINSDKITINQLLSHRSGIPDFTEDKDYSTWNTKAKTENEMIEIIAKAGSDFEPDSKAEYSNSNFVLLTYILEKTFNKPYSEIIIEYIAKPIGLNNTSLGGRINTKNSECNSYSFTGNWEIESETDISIPLGAGGIISTPTDLVKFGEALFSEKIISKGSLDKMTTIKDNFGMGLFQIPFYDKTAFGHTGGIDGFSSVLCYFPDDKVSYALVSNGANYTPNNISIAVLSAIFNKPYDIPVFTTFEVSPEDLEKYLGIYSSSQIPLKISISKQNKSLFAKATGQDAFLLEPFEKDKFKYDIAGIEIEFIPNDKKMILKQGGGTYNFSKEEQ